MSLEIDCCRENNEFLGETIGMRARVVSIVEMSFLREVGVKRIPTGDRIRLPDYYNAESCGEGS
jgi:hypothetical protein